MVRDKRMTEQQAQVTCPNCGRIKGHYQQVGDQVWLARDDEAIRVLRSVCACGVEFNYMASEKRLNIGS